MQPRRKYSHLQGVVGNGNHYVNQNNPKIERKVLNVSYTQILDLNVHLRLYTGIYLCVYTGHETATGIMRKSRKIVMKEKIKAMVE